MTAAAGLFGAATAAAGGTSMLAVAGVAIVAALAMAGGIMAGADAPWTAYAQQASSAQTVQIGALMTNNASQEFNDADRIRVAQYAVDQFNAQSAAAGSGGIMLNLTVTEITRGSEPARLVEAYDGGNGTLFYIGPTTSQGLANINATDASRAVLDSVVLVSPSSEAPELAVAGDNIFRLAVNIVRQGSLLVGEMESKGIESYVMVYRNDAWGRQLAAAVNETASAKGMAHRGSISFENDTSAEQWAGIADRIETSISGMQDGGGERTGVIFMGYDTTYTNMSVAANDSAALRNNTAWFAPSSSIGTSERISNDTSRNFSAAVGLTTLSEDVPSNPVAAAIGANLTGTTPTFYEYSTYDSVFVLGNAIRMAAASGGSGGANATINATTVAAAMPRAAMEYTGALGDGILLDDNGDLRTPDTFTVQRVDASGDWMAGTTSSTPVARIGALVALGYEHYPDDRTLDALRQAVADYNAGDGGGQRSLVKLSTHNITDSIVVARNTTVALSDAYDSGSGPSAYIGPTLSESLAQMVPYARDNGIILFSPGSEAETLSIAGDNVFRMTVSADRHGRFMAQVIADAGINSIVTVMLDDEWGRSLSASLARELAVRGVDVAGTVSFPADNSDWAATARNASSEITKLGTTTAGVAFIGTHDDQDNIAAALAPGSDGALAAAGVRWFVTPSGISQEQLDGNPASKALATATRMTGIVNYVGGEDGSQVRAALDSSGLPGLTFYEYAAYDALFVLGNAMRSNAEAGRENTAANLRAAIPAAADAYSGALGDVVLNSKGDLLMPDRFAVRQVDEAGTWMDTGTTRSTPVLQIGAMLALGSADYPDDRTLAAVRQAAADYNNRDDAAQFVRVQVHNITSPDDPSGYRNTADVLRAAHDGGSGPYAYIGPTLSSNLAPLLDYANENNIVLFSPGSEAQSLAVAGDNVFRMTVSTDRHGRFMAETMADAGVKSAVTVIRNDTWGRSLNSTLASALLSGGVMVADSVSFPDSGDANWTRVAAKINAAVEAIGAANTTGVALVGVQHDQDSIAAEANGTAAAGVQWFVTPSGIYDLDNATTRDLAVSTMMRGLALDVADGPKKAALDAAIGGDDLTFYEYAAYDTLFVLGSAASAAAAPGNATALKEAIPAAADAYAGILGDIVLNSKGDLLMPDRFAVRQVSAAGAWTDTGATKSTPVLRIGAMLALGSTNYADDRTLAAVRQAAADYNQDDAAQFVRVQVHDITDPADTNRYLNTTDVLRAAHGGGSGPYAYIGPTLSSNLAPLLDYANENGIILFSPGSEAQTLAVAGDNVFRMTVSTDRHGRFMAETMADAGVKSAVTVIRDDEWGRSLNSTLVSTLLSGGVRVADSVSFPDSGDANWTRVAAEINAAVKALGAVNTTGVALVGVQHDQDSIAAKANGTAAATVPWFVTPSGIYDLDNATTRGLAVSTMMTGLEIRVADGPKKAALDAAIGGLTFYEYAAYDTLFVLGSAASAAAAPGNATALKAAIPAAAERYVGILGDIALNSRGDLRTPDLFAVRQVNPSGAWIDTGATKSTPVVDIGGIVILESDKFDDSPRLAAMRLAVDDYNRAAEDGGPLYLNLVPVQTSLSPNAATATSPNALDAVTSASGDGIRYYVGPSTSGNSQRVLEYANANDLTLVSPSSTAPSLATPNDALFRLVPNDSQQGVVIADIIHNQQGAILARLINEGGTEHVIIVVRDDVWGQGLNASTAQRLDVHDIDITTIVHEEEDADWSDVASDLGDAISALNASAPDDPVAVLHIGFPGDFVDLANQSAAYPLIRTVPWYGTDGVAGASHVVSSAQAAGFADAVNLTATKFDVVSNEKYDAVRDALAAQGVQVRTTYEYSAYDSVFVLGRAIEAALANNASYTPSDVRAAVRAAASEYSGALGDIELNAAGDLRTPNSYAAWEVRDGAWEKIETHPSTPVFDIGALLMLDNNPIYTDDRELAAMRVAVDDFNTAHELIGDFYVNLAIQRISISPTDTASPDPDARAGLVEAYAGGSGPSYYVGPSTSGNTERVLEFANANNIILISHSSTAPSLAIPNDNLFRMVVPDSLQGIVLGDLIAKNSSVTDLVMAVRDDPWGRGVDEKTAERMGNFTNVTRVMFAESGADWAAVAASLNASIANATASAASKTDGRAAVLFVGFDGDFVGIAPQASSYSQLDTVPWFGPDGIGNSPVVTANATSLALAQEVNMTTVIHSVAPNDVNRRLDPLAVYGPSAYDSVYVMGNAIKAAYVPSAASAATPPQPQAVRAAIPGAAANYTGALGNVMLDANGDLSSPSTYAIYQMGADGAWAQQRIVDAGAGQPPPTPPMPPPPTPPPTDAVDCSDDSIRCITIGEIYTPGLTSTDEIHAAYELAVADYNRMELEKPNDTQKAYLELDRATIMRETPLDDLRTAYNNGTGPSMYLGPTLSAVSSAAEQFIDENGIVMISPTSQSTSPPSVVQEDTIFRLSLNDKYMADLIASVALRERVSTVIPVLMDNNTLAQGYGVEFKREADLHGIAVLDPVNVPANMTDLSGSVAEINRRVAALNVATDDLSTVGLLVVLSPPVLHNLADSAAGHPLLASVKWFEPGALFPPLPITDPETLSLARSVPLYSVSWNITQTANWERVRNALSGTLGSAPHQYAYSAYDAVFLLGGAIRESMDADGNFTTSRVAENIPAVAMKLNGLLGNITLDANGDRVSPSSLLVWKSASGSGPVWVESGGVQLDPACGISLASPTLAFANVNTGQPSDARTQTVTSTGTSPLESLTVAGTPWISTASNATVLEVGATQIRAGQSQWMDLSTNTAISLDSEAMDHAIAFRVNPPSSTPSGNAGSMSQTVTYVATCSAP